MTPIEEAAKAGNAAYQKAAYDIDPDWDSDVSEDEKRLAIIFARAVLRAIAATEPTMAERNASSANLRLDPGSRWSDVWREMNLAAAAEEGKTKP